MKYARALCTCTFVQWGLGVICRTFMYMYVLYMSVNIHVHMYMDIHIQKILHVHLYMYMYHTICVLYPVSMHESLPVDMHMY